MNIDRTKSAYRHFADRSHSNFFHPFGGAILALSRQPVKVSEIHVLRFESSMLRTVRFRPRLAVYPRHRRIRNTRGHRLAAFRIQAAWVARRVRAICDFVCDRLTFGYEHACTTRTAFEAYAERKGVSRDFAHLAVAFCRCMNIPARYANGFLGDIGADPGLPVDA